jgi:hypothetical protein
MTIGKQIQDGYCQLCGKIIDDDGEIFCSKCRLKSFKVRFKIIQGIAKRRFRVWETKGNLGPRKNGENK